MLTVKRPLKQSLQKQHKESVHQWMLYCCLENLVLEVSISPFSRNGFLRTSSWPLFHAPFPQIMLLKGQLQLTFQQMAFLMTKMKNCLPGQNISTTRIQYFIFVFQDVSEDLPSPTTVEYFQLLEAFPFLQIISLQENSTIHQQHTQNLVYLLSVLYTLHCQQHL